jgi:hypothetical protein
MIGVVKGRPVSPRLSERALARATVVRREALPDEVSTPWTIVCRKFKDVGQLNRVYFVIIPTARIRDWEGEEISNRDALSRAEAIYSIWDESRSDRCLTAVDRLVRSPAPASYDEGYGDNRRRYCTAHCVKCGLHFTSTAAFDEHALWNRHKHPSKLDKIVPVTEHDTGCYLMGTSYHAPITKYLPFFDQNTRYVPGVRLYEHIKAQTVREHFRGS